MNPACGPLRPALITGFTCWTVAARSGTLSVSRPHRIGHRSMGAANSGMAFALSIARAAAEHRDLSFWMKRTLEELHAVQTEPAAGPVHDLRVSLRRCRS